MEAKRSDLRNGTLEFFFVVVVGLFVAAKILNFTVAYSPFLTLNLRLVFVSTHGL